MKIHPLVFGSVVTNSAGNVLLAYAMKQMRDSLISAFADWEPLVICLTLLSSPPFLIGVALLITFFILFLTMLSKMDLSYVLPVTSFGYVVTAFLAALFLNETVSATRWAGIFLISFGVLLVSRGESSTQTSKTLGESCEKIA